MLGRFAKLHQLAYHPFVSGDQLDAAAFDGLPRMVGFEIPFEYIEFLREFPATGVFDVEGGVIAQNQNNSTGSHREYYSIAMLYGLCSDKRYDLLEIAARPVYDGDLPRHFLLIGDDVFGNMFCLDLRPQNLGQVLFWDHERGAAGYHLIADKFVSFIDGLQIDVG